MNLVELIHLAVRVSIILVVLGIALESRLPDVLYLFRRPGLLLRSFLAMAVIMPIFAAVLAAAFNLTLAVEIALIALALSPVPPILPKKEIKEGGSGSYTIGLFATAALLAVVVVPVELKLLGWAFGVQGHPSFETVGMVVLTSVLAPLVVGVIVSHLAPAFAARIARSVSLVGMVILGLAAVAILIGAWPTIMSLIGNGTLLAITVFVLVGLAVGHFLGGPDPDDRMVLALSTASRHPGVAIAVALINAPEQKDVGAAVLLYLIWSIIVSVPYLAWYKRRRASSA